MKSSLASTTASIRGWTLLQAGMTTSLSIWPLQPRSWQWGRPGCYEDVYWTLSQLLSTWNNLKDYNLLSWEADFLGQMVLQVGLQPVLGDFAVFRVARPQNLLPLWGQMTFCVHSELGGHIFLDSWSRVIWLCFGWPGHKIHCPCEAKRTFFIFCLPSILVLV